MEKISLNSSIEEETSKNHIYIINENGNREEVSSVEGLEIIFSGKNNVVELHAPFRKFIQSQIVCGESNYVQIGPSKYSISNLKINICFSCCKLTIGSNFSCRGALIYMQEPYTEIRIGNDCMFSEQIFITISDMHTIFDNNTKEVINKPQNIYIGNHVWLGFRTSILKGARLSDCSVAGTGSVITKTFVESNVIIAGNPAKIIRHNINWSHKPVFKFEEQKKSEEEELVKKEVLKDTLQKLQNKKLILWGASLYLADILKKNPKIAENILGIIDSNPARHYRKFYGCTIYPPEKLAELNPKLVISTVKNNHENVHREIKEYVNKKHPSIKVLPDIFA